METQIIYLKETNSFNDIFKKEHNKMPMLFKKMYFLYKNIFNIITKKNIEKNEIWILPIKEKYSETKLKKILNNNLKYQQNKYLISNKLKDNNVCKIMNELHLEYITEEKIKKYLIFEAVKHILNLHNKKLSDLEITLLVNNTSSLNMYLIEELAKQVKTLKIVSLNIYKFKSLEEKLYTEYGIPIQFSNNYRKSLEKSKLIINFDFSEFEINEYEIFNNAIIINCLKENIQIKNKLFNGIVVNSYNIKYKKELMNKFKNMQISENYSKLILYASIIEEKNIEESYKKIDEDGVSICGLVGNNGILCKKEIKEKLKNIFLKRTNNDLDKKLDKNEKKE